MPGRLWLVLVWLLLAHAPGAAGAPGSPRRPRSYPHLEGEVPWRVHPSGRVQGTRRRHRPGSESARDCPGCGGGHRADSSAAGEVIIRVSWALLPP